MTQRSDIFVPEVIAEEVMKGFSGKLVLTGSGAIVLNPTLERGAGEVGNTVTVPYIEDGGEAQVITESAAGSLEKITMSTESATVVRLFKGFSVTHLAAVAKATGRDINEVAADMVASGCARALETVAIQRGLARAVSGSMEYDGTAGNINPDAIVETLKLFGEELDDSQLAVWAMNAKPYWDAAKISDSTGRALYTDGIGGRLRELAWVNPSVKIDFERDPTADVDMVIGNMYAVVHAYGTMPGGTKPGVAVLKTR